MNHLAVTVIASLTLLIASSLYSNGGESSKEEQNQDHPAQEAEHDHGQKHSATEASSKSCVTTNYQDCKAIGKIADQLYEAHRRMYKREPSTVTVAVYAAYTSRSPSGESASDLITGRPKLRIPPR